MSIQEILFNHQDAPYGDFIAKLVPTLPREAFIGIRSPEYKSILKEIKLLPPDEVNTFLNTLPHKYHEENALHAAIINEMKDYDECISALEKFLPYVNNWAVSDGLGSKALDKNHDKLILKIQSWIESDLPYTKRVAMLFIKKYFLKEDYKPVYLEWAAAIRSDEYYVKMMIAWLFADALVYQWDSAINFIVENKMDPWTHNKAIQKARESFRISPENKEYLKSLKRSCTKN